MSYLVCEIRLAIPEDTNGTLTLASKDELGNPVGGIKIPTALAAKLPAIRTAIRELKSYARKINEGQPNEEMTVQADVFICHHDNLERLIPDEARQEISSLETIKEYQGMIKVLQEAKDDNSNKSNG